MISLVAQQEAPPFAEEIKEHQVRGLTVLSLGNARPRRRVLYVNSYGGAAFWQRVKRGQVAPHHLWGCLELVRMGYEVALAEPLPDFYLLRNPLPHDLKLLKLVRAWLGADGIVYCGHNILYWLPFLRALGAHRCRIVSLLFAREPLALSRAHSGVIALTGAAMEQARKLAPRAKVAHLGWGADLSVFPRLRYDPQWFLSCGRTLRDHEVLSAAAALSHRLLRVICPQPPAHVSWPSNVQLLTGGVGEDTFPFEELLRNHYAACAASLIILKHDPAEATAVGMTNVIEAMAMSRAVIVTRTGALPTEIDVEKSGCGLHVPAGDAHALAAAIHHLATHRQEAEGMGARGRALCESRFNITRYARELHEFFENL